MEVDNEEEARWCGVWSVRYGRDVCPFLEGHAVLGRFGKGLGKHDSAPFGGAFMCCQRKRLGLSEITMVGDASCL